MNIYNTIASLIDQAVKMELIEERDMLFVRNQVLAQLHLDSFPNEALITEGDIPDLLEYVTNYAVEAQLIEDVFDDKEMFQANVMNCFMPRPSTVQQTFWDKYMEHPEVATNYFYELSKNSNYIQMKRIKKNVHFIAETIYGALDITINLSKPEKDPEQIRREKEMKKTLDYPPCVLCIENRSEERRVGKECS